MWVTHTKYPFRVELRQVPKGCDHVDKMGPVLGVVEIKIHTKTRPD